MVQQDQRVLMVQQVRKDRVAITELPDRQVLQELAVVRQALQDLPASAQQVRRVQVVELQDLLGYKV